jgi:hypothetical protein
MTALMLATQAGRLDIVQYLVTNGASVIEIDKVVSVYIEDTSEL